MQEATIQYDVDPEVMSSFLDESEESIATLDSLFVKLEQQPKNKEIIGSIFRVAHSIKGLAAFLNLKAMKELTHELESVLDNIRNDKLRVDSAIIDCLLVGFDELSNMLGRVRSNQREVVDKLKFQGLINKIKELSDSNTREESQDISEVLDNVCDGVTEISQRSTELTKVHKDTIEEAVQKKEDANKPPPPMTSGRTMRVSEEKVDAFMEYVGDLIEISESFNLLQKRIDRGSNMQIAREFKTINSRFNQLGDKLQKSLLEIRKVPAKNLLQKIPRMARDLAQSLNKKVQVEITGQDIQIDKSMIEALESPINHLVRNCVDHGIESPQDRQQAQKSEIGTIRIDINDCGDKVTIKIEDDGAGINPEKIRNKAMQMGLVSTDKAKNIDDREVLQFIFSSGFSTAQQVSDVSGRGVGMDVVRTNVESLKGTIDLESTYGQGTTVTLSLPSSMTVLVVNGMLVSIGEQEYIIKVEDIQEAIRPQKQEILTVGGKAECLNIRGRIYPLIRLHQLFGIEPEFTKPTDAMAILVQAKNNSAAILVGKILGQQKVVVKELQGQFSSLRTIAGTAILANSRVGLVLDIEGIIAEYLES